ncbi:MAG: HD-GYP domain-containing protein [Candidatus Omnitrophica bacterium]|nr:HD-GYP domain-containing protein [Candidatus Omnitrophota bacterium]
MESTFVMILTVILAAVVATATIVIISLANSLRAKETQLEHFKGQVMEWNRQMENRVQERTRLLEDAHHNLKGTYREVVLSLVEATAAKYFYLSSHAHNVAVYAKAIARELSLPEDRLEQLVQGCKLHDLGKIGVPDSILMKRDGLTPEEIEIVKQHPVWGARILEPLTSLKTVTQMVLQEHERWDGTGYPNKLKGEEIILEARIIAVADALDAMISDRPYREPVSPEVACEELQRSAGTQFDPKVVEACVRAIQKKTLVAATGHQTLSKSKERRE